MRKLVFLTAIFFVATFMVSTGWCFNVSEFDEVYQFDGGHYYAVISGRLSWTEAASAAESLDHNGIKGHLATLTTEAENNFVWENLGGDLKHYWLGGKRTGSPEEPTGGWSWVTEDEQWEFPNWFSPAELNNSGGGQDYLSFWSGPGGKWMNARNDWGGAKGYIVEFSSSQAVPLPAPIWLLASGVLGLVAIRRSYGK
jgi:hypothetical protein